MFFLGSQLKRRTAVLLSRAAFSFSIFSVAVLVPLSLLLLPPPVCFHAVSDNPPARRRVFLSLSPLTSPRPWPLLRWGSAGNYDLSPRDGDMPAQCRKDGGAGAGQGQGGFNPGEPETPSLAVPASPPPVTGGLLLLLLAALKRIMASRVVVLLLLLEGFDASAGPPVNTSRRPSVVEKQEGPWEGDIYAAENDLRRYQLSSMPSFRTYYRGLPGSPPPSPSLPVTLPLSLSLSLDCADTCYLASEVNTRVKSRRPRRPAPDERGRRCFSEVLTRSPPRSTAADGRHNGE